MSIPNPVRVPMGATRRLANFKCCRTFGNPTFIKECECKVTRLADKSDEHCTHKLPLLVKVC